MVTEEELLPLTVGEELAGHRISIDLDFTEPTEVQRRIWAALAEGPAALKLQRSQGTIYQWRKGVWVQLDRGSVARLVNACILLWHSRSHADDYWY